MATKIKQLLLSWINGEEQPRPIHIYWGSSSARDFFILVKDESATLRLIHRTYVLGMAVDGDKVVVILVCDIDNITDLTNKQQTSLYNKCLYLRYTRWYYII